MATYIGYMKNIHVDDRIAQIKNITLPSCPGTLEQNVLRRLRLDLTNNQASIPFWVLPSTGLRLGTVALALLCTVATTVGISNAQLKHQSRRSLAAQALDFDVFKNLNVHQSQRSHR